MTHRAHIIAEAGTNHGGDISVARRLIDVAASSGADSVKFQLIYPEGLYLPRIYADGVYQENEVFQLREAARMSDDEYRELAGYATGAGCPLTLSVFDSRGIRLADELDVAYIKIASCDLNNSRLIIEAAETGRTLVLSTGMASLGEIERAVTDFLGTGNERIVLMHCVSVYPCCTSDMNLHFLKILQEAFGLPVGLSDHTEHSLGAAVAVSMGARWVEKHFTLDRNAPGFDHAYAMEPESLVEYVQDVRSVEAACAPRQTKVLKAEVGVRTRARRGLWAARDIEEGALIDEGDVLIVRPEGPLKPNEISELLGKRAVRRICQYQALTRDSVC